MQARIVYKDPELPTCTYELVQSVCAGFIVNTFSFRTLSKETERVLRDLPAQARPVSSSILYCVLPTSAGPETCIGMPTLRKQPILAG